MSRTILELCQALPDSEAELRARADEFNLAVEQALHIPTRWAARNYVDNIADAAAATDALIALGWHFGLERGRGNWCAEFCSGFDSFGIPALRVEAEATTESLARSAAAYLAAMAIDAVPQSDEDVYAVFLANYKKETAFSLAGIYHCERGMGANVRDAYAATLRAYLECCQKAKAFPLDKICAFSDNAPA